jgi:hypothetical protein
MHALNINLAKKEKVQVGIFNFAMIYQCLKEMIQLLLVLLGLTSIEMHILYLVRINMV